jgi:phenylalanyl-tRNA synthetase beta chain
MKISYNWLLSLIKTELSAEEAANLLTAAGIEVEAIEHTESIRGGLKDVVVGHVLECSKHPDADRLSVTKVDTGNGHVASIVCGAPNVKAGQKVIVAKPGAVLHTVSGEVIEIKKSKIRGVVSEGMICAEDEIGLGTSHAGIMVLPEDTRTGQPASEYFKVEKDTILEIGLTPNRNDASSHYGIARELAAILNYKSHSDTVTPLIQGSGALPVATGIKKISVKVQAGCERYSGLLIEGIKVGESPAWLRSRLTSIGIRPINNIVDITNFVLHELGQPLHAFDADKIKGDTVIVRHAAQGEKLVTLDGTETILTPGDLVIADAADPICIAGVLGGKHSGVSDTTTTVFLESAFFDSTTVRRTAKNHGLKTEASSRFERGTDPAMTVTALLRAANLMLEIAGGKPCTEIIDVYPQELQPFRVAFSYRNCIDLIGKDIDRQEIKKILSSLGISIDTEGTDGLLLLVPRYKNDVTREADVIEEVLRIYGYNNVEPGKTVSYSFKPGIVNASALTEKACRVLEGFGFNEIMSLSLSRESYYTGENLVKVVNPLSSALNVLRADMLYSGLEAIAHNLSRKNSNLRFFEVGKTYSFIAAENRYEEKKKLCLFVTGEVFEKNAFNHNQKSDYHLLKGCVSVLLEKCGVLKLSYKENSYPHLEEGQDLFVGKRLLGHAGEVKKTILKKFDIDQPVFYAVIDEEILIDGTGKEISFTGLNKFPEVKRDLSLLLDHRVTFEDLRTHAFAAERKLLRDVEIFDIYKDKSLGDKKSYALTFTLVNEEATLTDKQIDGVMDKLIKVYREKLNADIRG